MATEKLATNWLATHIGTIEGFLDNRECAELIADSERRGFEEATVSSGGRESVAKYLRDNDRVIFDDDDLADLFFARAKPLLYARFGDWKISGFNERFRFYRYGPGQKFDWHNDGYFERPGGERSQFTFMIYLSDGFEGGGTSFRGEMPGYSGFSLEVKPSKGMALAFYHPLNHRGDEVLSGRKYVLRTDVMYRPV
jgi:hypothetical protein